MKCFPLSLSLLLFVAAIVPAQDYSATPNYCGGYNIQGPNGDSAQTTSPAIHREVRLQSKFPKGYKAGYKQAYPVGPIPNPPVPPPGKNTWGDGYGMGYAQGLADKP